jgi:hypothetical protein
VEYESIGLLTLEGVPMSICEKLRVMPSHTIVGRKKNQRTAWQSAAFVKQPAPAFPEKSICAIRMKPIGCYNILKVMALKVMA